jgi:hypothetical protein
MRRPEIGTLKFLQVDLSILENLTSATHHSRARGSFTAAPTFTANLFGVLAMKSALRHVALRIAFCASAALGALGLPSISAAETMPDVVIDQGVACSDFALGISSRGGNQVYREFLDRNNNVVRWLSAGKGSVLTFTNMTTGEELTIKTGGSVTHVTNNPDGSQTWTSTGHNVWILFPSDVPAGPSTTLYLGKVVFRIDPQTFFSELLVESAQKIDICAALAS